jgi:hypothetical protein
MKGVTLAISTYNQPSIFEVLRHADKQGFDEILIIDDHDNNVEKIKEFIKSLSTKTRLVVTKKPYGPWATKTLSVRLAHNDYVVHIDGDCIPVSNLREKHSKWLSQGFIFSFGKAINKGNLLARAFASEYYFTSPKHIVDQPVKFFFPQIFTLTGNNFAFNRKLIKMKEIPDLSLYGGDDIYFVLSNMRATGLPAVFDPSIKVFHNHPHSLKGLIRKYYLYGVGGGINYQYFGKINYYTEPFRPIRYFKIIKAIKENGILPVMFFFLQYPLYAVVSSIGFSAGKKITVPKRRIEFKEIRV